MGAGKFPSLAGWRSAVCVIGISILWPPPATLQGRWNWIGGGVRLEADVFGQEVGVLAQPIARPFDLDDDGVVKQSVEKGRRDDGITGHLWMPQPLTGESLRSGSLTRIIRCMAAAFRSANDALAEGRR